MKIRSTTPVIYNDGIKAQSSDIVVGHILNCSWLNDKYDEIGFNYAYTLEPDEEGNITVLFKGAFTLKGAEIEALYQAVKDQVPAGLTYAETQQYLHYLGFIQEMASTFEIAPSDIEIVL